MLDKSLAKYGWCLKCDKVSETEYKDQSSYAGTYFGAKCPYCGLSYSILCTNISKDRIMTSHNDIYCDKCKERFICWTER